MINGLGLKIVAKTRNNRERSPKSKVSPKAEKSPQISGVTQTSFQGSKIRWSFSIIEMDGPFGWSKCSLLDLKKVLKPRLSNFETMTWGEIEGQKHHSIPTNDLSKEAQDRLSEKNYDTDDVFSLALRGKERVIGIRDRDVFKLLWWDPKHKVCLSRKKYT